MPQREIRYVSREMHAAFWSEWHAIDQRFPHFSEAPEGVSLQEHWANVASLRAAARQELRTAIRSIEHFGGPFPLIV